MLPVLIWAALFLLVGLVVYRCLGSLWSGAPLAWEGGRSFPKRKGASAFLPGRGGMEGLFGRFGVPLGAFGRRFVCCNGPHKWGKHFPGLFSTFLPALGWLPLCAAGGKRLHRLSRERPALVFGVFPWFRLGYPFVALGDPRHLASRCGPLHPVCGRGQLLRV